VGTRFIKRYQGVIRFALQEPDPGFQAVELDIPLRIFQTLVVDV
jgi:hypothetical protein